MRMIVGTLLAARTIRTGAWMRQAAISMRTARRTMVSYAPISACSGRQRQPARDRGGIEEAGRALQAHGEQQQEAERQNR
jgi:hypothetical protein